MSKEPKRNVYVGHRYVPKLMDEWDKTISYEGLSIVTYQGTSYTSKKHVPVGIDILNEEYWTVTGNYNAQVEHYRKDVRDMEDRVNNEMSKTTDYVDNELNSVNQQLAQRPTILFETMTVNIPTDFPSLQEAIDHLSEKHHKNKKIIILKIESGYRPSAGIRVENGDYSHFRIESADAEVLVTDNLTGTFMTAINAKMPVLACLINQNQKGYAGYWLEDNSTGKIEPGCGIKNAGVKGNYEHRGLYVGSGSILSGDGAIFTNAGGRGAWITRGATVSLELSNFDNAGDVGIYVSRNSTVHMPYSSVQNAGSHALWVHRTSRLNAQDGINLSGAGGNALFTTRASLVSINDGAIANNIGGKGIEAIDSIVVCNAINLTGKSGNTQNGIEANGGKIHADNAIVYGFGGQGIFAQRTGVVSAEGAKVTNSGVNGIAVDRLGKVFIGKGEVKNSINKDLALFVGAGGEINAYLCKTTDSTDNNPAIGNTNITGATPSFNTQVGNRGIIWA